MNKLAETPKFKETEEEKEDNVVDFKLITGGKEPPADGDWLSELAEGTIFYARNKQKPQEFILGTFRLCSKVSKSTVILQEKSTPEPFPVWPLKFCQVYSLHEEVGVLEVPQEQEEPKEEVSDERDRVQGDGEPTTEPMGDDAGK